MLLEVLDIGKNFGRLAAVRDVSQIGRAHV